MEPPWANDDEQGDEMPEQLHVSFEYSRGDLKESIRQHLRSPVRRWSRVAGTVLCVLCWLAFAFLMLLLHYAPAATLGAAVELLLFIVLVLVSLINVAQYPGINAFLVRKRYRHIYGERLDWEFYPDTYRIKIGELSQGQSKWANLARLIRTPTGVLLYHHNGVFNWLPLRSFGDESEVEALLQMARANNIKVMSRS